MTLILTRWLSVIAGLAFSLPLMAQTAPPQLNPATLPECPLEMLQEMAEIQNRFGHLDPATINIDDVKATLNELELKFGSVQCKLDLPPGFDRNQVPKESYVHIIGNSVVLDFKSAFAELGKMNNEAARVIASLELYSKHLEPGKLDYPAELENADEVKLLLTNDMLEKEFARQTQQNGKTTYVIADGEIQYGNTIDSDRVCVLDTTSRELITYPNSYTLKLHTEEQSDYRYYIWENGKDSIGLSCKNLDESRVTLVQMALTLSDLLFIHPLLPADHPLVQEVMKRKVD